MKRRVFTWSFIVQMLWICNVEGATVAIRPAKLLKHVSSGRYIYESPLNNSLRLADPQLVQQAFIHATLDPTVCGDCFYLQNQKIQHFNLKYTSDEDNFMEVYGVDRGSFENQIYIDDYGRFLLLRDGTNLYWTIYNQDQLVVRPIAPSQESVFIYETPKVCDQTCSGCTFEGNCFCDKYSHRKHLVIKRNCECIAGFYMETNFSCLACSTNCLTCEVHASKCLTCHPNQLREFHAQFECLCKESYYDDDNVYGICKACHYSCLTCVKKITCLSCVGLQISGRLDYSTPASTCPCAQGFVDEGKSNCLRCDINCLQCLPEDHKLCTSCKGANRELVISQCLCLAGYYEVQGAQDCGKCSKTCQICLTIEKCVSCQSGRQLTSNNECACKVGSYDDGKQCQPCKNSCLACRDDKSCITCDVTALRVLVKGNCVCKPGTIFSNENCIIINEKLLKSQVNTLKGPQASLLNNLVDNHQKLSGKYQRKTLVSFQMIGFLNFLVNTQAIFQLRFINYTTSINIYETEVMIIQTNANQGFPLYWDLLAWNSTGSTQIFFHEIKINYTQETPANTIFEIQNMTPLFLINCQFSFVILLLLFMLYLRYRCQGNVRETMKHQKEFYANLKLPEDQSKCLEEIDRITQKIRFMTHTKLFAYIMIYLDTQFGVIVLSVCLQFTNWTTNPINIVSLTMCFLLLLIIGYLISQAFHKCYNQLMVEKTIKRHSHNLNNMEIQQIKCHLRASLAGELWCYFSNRRNDTYFHLFFWILTYLKKILFAVIIVTLQEHITIQLAFIGVVACTQTMFKLYIRHYQQKRFLILIVCEIIFEVTVIFRITDYHFYLEISGLSQLDESYFFAWIQNGWKTVWMEVIYFCSLLVHNLISIGIILWGRTSQYCKAKAHRNRMAATALYPNPGDQTICNTVQQIDQL